MPANHAIALVWVARDGPPSQLGQPEVQHLRRAGLGDNDVGGLQIAVDDSGGVRAGQRIGDLDGVAERFSQFEPVVRDQAVQRLAWNILHHQIVEPGIVPEVVDW